MNQQIPPKKPDLTKTEKIIRDALKELKNLKPVPAKKVPKKPIQWNLNLSFKINELIKYFKPSKPSLVETLSQNIVTGVVIGIAIQSSRLLFTTVASEAPKAGKFLNKAGKVLKSRISRWITAKQEKQSWVEKLTNLDCEKYFEELSLDEKQFVLLNLYAKICNLLYFQNFDAGSFEKFLTVFFMSIALSLKAPLLIKEQRKIKENQFENNTLLKFRGGGQEEEEEGSGEKKAEQIVSASDETWSRMGNLITASVHSHLKLVIQSFVLFLFYNIAIRVFLGMVKLHSFHMVDIIKLTILELKTFWGYFSTLKKFPKNILFTSHNVDYDGFLMFRCEQIYECIGNCGTAFADALNDVRKDFKSPIVFEMLGTAVKALNAQALDKFYQNPNLFPEFGIPHKKD
jgi:hypothetical protein